MCVRVVFSFSLALCMWDSVFCGWWKTSNTFGLANSYDIWFSIARRKPVCVSEAKRTNACVWVCVFNAQTTGKYNLKTEIVAVTMVKLSLHRFAFCTVYTWHATCATSLQRCFFGSLLPALSLIVTVFRMHIPLIRDDSRAHTHIRNIQSKHC